MHRLITILILATTPFLVSSASARVKIACTDVQTAAGTTIGNCQGGGGATIPGLPGMPRRPVELITAVSRTPEVGTCTILASPTSGPGERQLAFRTALDSLNDVFDPLLRQGLFNDLWARVLAGLPGCPGPEPSEVAFAFLREIIPPGPDPWIAPGYALTGKPSFVETRMPTSNPQRYDTPLGPLDVILRATTVAVDWGDGTGADEGPFPSPSKPWPDGKATHTFTVMGAYDVVVTQVWDADWRLAGQAGTVRGLTSVGRLDDFEARQLQAVRNR